MRVMRSRRASAAAWVWCAVLVVLPLAVGRAAPLPDARQAATQVGREIVFEDVVKAISRSRTKGGCYFSFGEPFPKQVLSVWVSDEVYYQLPYDPGVIGRTVRIRGQLATTATGPMVTLVSPEDFELLGVDDAMLSKVRLDGTVDRQHFMAAVAQAFWREDFPTLEQLAGELRQSHERFTDGTWVESAFFKALEIASDEADERYVAAGLKIEHWLARFPPSATATVVQAGYHLDLASHDRQASAGLEAAAAKEGSQRETALARQILEGNPAAKTVPEYFVKWQVAAYYQGWPRAAFFQLFDEAVRSEPEYYSFYFQTARYLLGGSGEDKGNWEQFAEEQRQRRGAGGEGDALYARIAWSMSVNYRNVCQESTVSWETMAAGFERLIAQHPKSVWLKNAYANFAFKARDRQRLRAALPAVVGQPDMGVWVNLENVSLAQKFAAEEPTSRKP